MLPEGEDINEWVASHIVDFNKQLGMVYGTLTHHCTEESCPVMKAGDKYEYHWADGIHICPLLSSQDNFLRCSDGSMFHTPSQVVC